MDTTPSAPPKKEPEAVVEQVEPKKKKVITTKKVKKAAAEDPQSTVLKSVENTTPIDTKLSESEANTLTEPVKADDSIQDENVAPGTVEGPKKEGEEDEDYHGTKKMRSDFDTKMDSLAAEMEAGRSKLAKLRERIRRAKGAIKEADDAMAKTMNTWGNASWTNNYFNLKPSSIIKSQIFINQSGQISVRQVQQCGRIS